MTSVQVFLIFVLLGVSWALMEDQSLNAGLPCQNSIPFSQYMHTANSDHFTYNYKLSRPLLVTSLAINTTNCPADRALIEETFTITYTDALDVTMQTIVFAKDVSAKLSQFDDATFVVDFNGVMFTKSLSVTTSSPLQCSHVHLYGCETSDMCLTNSCVNGGRCVGDGRCACPKGFYGEKCEIPIDDMLVDDFRFVDQRNNSSISTLSAEFDVNGDVTFVPSNETSRQRRFLLNLGLGSCHFHGHCSLISAFRHHFTTHFHSHNFHSSLSASSIFNSNGFSHSCSISFGLHHNHNHISYLYTTHGHNHNRLGVSLHYTNGHLHMHANFRHGHYHLSAAFSTKPSTKYTITSCLSHLLGLSLYVNGHLLGSQTKPLLSSIALPHQKQQPLCIGSCGNTSVPGPLSMVISNPIAVGASVATLAVNGLLSLLGLGRPIINGGTIPTTVSSVITSPPSSVTLTTVPSATATSKTPVITTTSGPTGAVGSLCYQCLGMAKDASCSAISTCQAGEVCALYHDTVGYTHRCLNKQICELAQNRTMSDCWTCCSSSLCNDKCPAVCKDTPLCGQILSTGYKVCGDAVLAQADCKKTCGQCGGSG